MKIYLPIAKVDTERREVWGYASTEARDDQGEIVKRDALVSALSDYMKFANIREMHQLSAVGIAKEATVDDKGLYIGAKIVDDQAWQKVVAGVYKGYSIGGRITERDPADFKTITGLELNEISLVDRPANPEAVFDYWRAAAVGASNNRFDPPYQIWACGVREHRHLAKADALRCQQLAASGSDAAATESDLGHAAPGSNIESDAGDKEPYGEIAYADPGYQSDGKKRYPIDTEAHIRAAWNFINRPSHARRYTSVQFEHIKRRIIAAWKARVDKDGPPSDPTTDSAQTAAGKAMTKALLDVGQVARVIVELQWLKDNLASEAAMEADDSPQPARLQTIIGDLCDFLTSLVVEETGELLDQRNGSEAPREPSAATEIAQAAGSRGTALVSGRSRGSEMGTRQFEAAVLAKAGDSSADQALLDLACHCVDKCLQMDGLPFVERNHLSEAREALQAAGARPVEGGSSNRNSDDLNLARPNGPPRQIPNTDMSDLLHAIAAALGKRGSSHQVLLDFAHDCIGKLTDQSCCAGKSGARHSRQTAALLGNAHDHLVAAGARCAARPSDHAKPAIGDPTYGKIGCGDLAKTPCEGPEDKTLRAALREILPRLDRLTQRVEDIARTPLPPLAMAKDVTGLSKRQDAISGDLSPDDLAAAFARMSKEEQTLMLIKASHARPIQPPGLSPAREAGGD